MRVQAIATDHLRQSELGDGPAFALTYGVPTIPAALLCQMGFASRTGALRVTQQLGATFKDTDGLRDWLRENDAFLADPEFWESQDHHLMWRNGLTPSAEGYPKPWSHSVHDVAVKWTAPVPHQGSATRIISGSGYTGTVCSSDLVPLGTVQLPFDPHAAALDARVDAAGHVRIEYFGADR